MDVHIVLGSKSDLPVAQKATELLKRLGITYKMDVAVHRQDGAPYDYHRLLYTFRVKSRTRDVGIYRPRHTWTFSPNVEFGPSQAGARAAMRADAKPED